MTHAEKARELAEKKWDAQGIAIWATVIIQGFGNDWLAKEFHRDLLSKIQIAITTTHAQGFAECREVAAKKMQALADRPKSPYGHHSMAYDNAVTIIRALQPAAPGGEGEGK